MRSSTACPLLTKPTRTYMRRLRCTSGQILPGDKLLLVNGAAVTGLQTEVVEQMIQAVADQGTAVALTVVSQPCTGQG